MCSKQPGANGQEILIACGGKDPGCGGSTESTSDVLGDVTYDKNLNPDNPLTNPGQ